MRGGFGVGDRNGTASDDGSMPAATEQDDRSTRSKFIGAVQRVPRAHPAAIIIISHARALGTGMDA